MSGGGSPGRLGSAALLLAGLVLCTPAAARAHTELRGSSPADSAALDAVPTEVRLRFSGPVGLGFTTIELLGPDGRPIPLDAPRHPADSANIIVARIAGALPAAGTYAIRWQTAAADGHPIRGTLTFTVNAGAAGLPGPVAAGADTAGADTATARVPDTAAATPRVAPPSADPFTARAPLFVAVRWVLFAGLLGTIGAVMFRLLILGLPARRGTLEPAVVAAADTNAARLGLVAAAIIAAATLLRLYLQSRALHGPAAALDPGRLANVLLRTSWGWGWLLQAAAAALALAGFALHGRRPAVGWGLALLAVIGLGFSPAFTGHAAAAASRIPVALLADGLHVIGAGAWLGTLLVLVVAGIPAALRAGDAAGRNVAALVTAFSPAALAFAGVVVGTGVFSAWIHLGSFAALVGSAYGRVLLAKLAAVVLVFLAGAYNWRRMKPGLGTTAAARRLRGSAMVELGAGLLVLLVTAVLVATPPPG